MRYFLKIYTNFDMLILFVVLPFTKSELSQKRLVGVEYVLWS